MSSWILPKVSAPQVRDDILPLRMKVNNHPLFETIQRETWPLSTIEKVFGQYWYPLHYFPTFLGKAVSASALLEVKTFLSRILFQELGEGNPSRAHERLYIQTLRSIGVDTRVVQSQMGLPATLNLMELYERKSGSFQATLGLLYATEIIDLAVVGGLGKMLEPYAGKSRLPWVDVHVLQEPDHVNSVDLSLDAHYKSDDLEQIEASVREGLEAWNDFLTGIHSQLLLGNS